jgi:hypothetical protein
MKAQVIFKNTTINSLKRLQAHVELLKAQGASADAIADAKEELDRATKSRDEFTKSVERSKKVTEDFDNALKRNIKTFTGITDGF